MNIVVDDVDAVAVVEIGVVVLVFVERESSLHHVFSWRVSNCLCFVEAQTPTPSTYTHIHIHTNIGAHVRNNI